MIHQNTPIIIPLFITFYSEKASVLTDPMVVFNKRLIVMKERTKVVKTNWLIQASLTAMIQYNVYRQHTYFNVNYGRQLVSLS